MSKKNALHHAIAWAIQNIYKTNKEAKEILDDEKLSEQEKMTKLRGPTGADYRLINLLLLLEPMLDEAKKAFPDQEDFFSWFNERWQYVKDNKMIEGVCRCKGCSPDDDSLEHAKDNNREN